MSMTGGMSELVSDPLSESEGSEVSSKSTMTPSSTQEEDSTYNPRSPIQPKGLGHRGQSSSDKAAEDLHQDTAGPVEVTGAHKKLLDHEIPVDPFQALSGSQLSLELVTTFQFKMRRMALNRESVAAGAAQWGIHFPGTCPDVNKALSHGGSMIRGCFWNALIFAPVFLSCSRVWSVNRHGGVGVPSAPATLPTLLPLHNSYRCNQNIRPKDPRGGCFGITSPRGMPKVPHLRLEVPHSLTLAARAVLRPPLGLGRFTFSKVNLMLEKDWYECSKSSSTEQSPSME
ncbi:hypothetical protein C8J56DRAFT_890526 [Mycena floridula]|nr:hypothetical protein C8J56DRAFT_890526 [Mycena floridula]